MPLFRRQSSFSKLDASVLAEWRKIPAAVASDCMNRAQTMSAAVKPLSPGMKICAQARTVACMVGDNSAIHAVMRIVEQGEALVIDAGGFADAALWGGLLTEAAISRGVAGIVLDGASRDAAEIRDLQFPCFTTAIVPAGPHKGFGGTIDGPVSCAGCCVQSGDLVLADDDGVAIVPLAEQEGILKASQDKLAEEAQAIEDLKAGHMLADRLGIPEPTLVP